MSQSRVPSLPKARLEAFSDGVIAIIVTILVLEIHVPSLNGADIDELLYAAMAHALPTVAAYAASFIVVLVFWTAHQHLMHSLVRVDRNLQWLNGLFLMVLAFVPAPTAIIGQYPQTKGATVLYGAVLALSGLAFALMRWYATARPGLMHESISRADRARAVWRGMLSPILYGAGAVIGLIDRHLAWALFLVVPLLYILPGAFDRAAHRLEH
jgi:uncharacterized membrane protein